MAIGPPAPVGEAVDAIVLIPLINPVARLARNPEFRANRGQLLAIQQAGDEPESRPRRDTLSRACPLLWGQSVTHVSGINCYPLTRKDTNPTIGVPSTLPPGDEIE